METSNVTNLPPRDRRGNSKPPWWVIVVLVVVGLLIVAILAYAIYTDGSTVKAHDEVVIPPPTTSQSDLRQQTYSLPPPSPSAPTSYSFGQRARWDDGVSAIIRVSKRNFPAPGFMVRFTITNGTDAPIDLAEDAQLRLGSDGSNAMNTYGADSCDGPYSAGSLAPGRSVTTTICFLGKADTVDVSASPEVMRYEALTWTGKPS